MDKFKYIFKYVTPFNLVLLGVVITAFFTGYIFIKMWSISSGLKTVLPDHRIIASSEQSDLKVTIFYDYQCPFCYKIDPLVRNAAKKDGNVELLFKLLPFFGEESWKKAQYAYAAGKQDKFLEYHDFMMKNGGRPLDEDMIAEIANEVGIDQERFIADAESKGAEEKIQANLDEAMFVGIGSTPTLMIGDTFFVPGKHKPVGRMPTEEEIEGLFSQERARNE